jgi:hypothetical protein
MKNSIYIDGISNIVMVDGIIRFDLVTIAKTTQPPQKAVPPPVETIAAVATSLQGFLRIHEHMSGVVKNMIDQGLIKITPAAEQSKPPEAIQIEPPATK